MVDHVIVALFLAGLLVANMVCVCIVLSPFYFSDFWLALVFAGAITWPIACACWFVLWLTVKQWVYS